MGEITATPDAEAVDATHLTGDLYFVNHYRRAYWYLAAALSVLVPPAGVFLLSFFILSCVTTGSDELELTPADA